MYGLNFAVSHLTLHNWIQTFLCKDSIW